VAGVVGDRVVEGLGRVSSLCMATCSALIDKCIVVGCIRIGLAVVLILMQCVAVL